MSTFEDMVDFIEAAWPARKFIVPCLEGPTGIGKTAACEHVAEKLGADVVRIIASNILPNEVSGITMPDAETKAMEIYDHFKLGHMKDGDILFFDELLEADQLVLSACLTLIESRFLLSGRKMADVMIVAATNATVKPNMLKENIRQRFVWQHFDIDKQGCREYIKKTCGFDVGLGISEMLTGSGNEYNILTPRSLTKMCQWICSAEDKDQMKDIAAQINRIWHNYIGTELMNCKLESENDAKHQVWKAINTALDGHGVVPEDLDELSKGMGDVMYNEETFEQTSMSELMEVLQQLPEWNAIAEELSKLEIEDEVRHEVVDF